MIIYADQLSPRLKYIAAFIGRHINGRPPEITDQKDVYFSYQGSRINYSLKSIHPAEIRIEPSGLLGQTGIHEQHIDISPDDPSFRFFKNNGDGGFDIFSAIFFLLTRYEEYLPHVKDQYGRYAHTNSVAFIYHFLQLPVIDRWLLELKQMLSAHYPPDNKKPDFKFHYLPTYDIDMAWSYREKGLVRNFAGITRAFLKGRTNECLERWNVWRGKTADPFDSFGWLDNLHNTYRLDPLYFFLLAERRGIYDKNIYPSGDTMRELVKRISSRYSVAIHPSWRSGDEPQLVEREIKILENLSGKKVNTSRQHYIRLTLPATYRELDRLGIKHEHSMGYGSINGFRASTSNSFYWYDLENEVETTLLVHPFCFMDANSFYEQHFSAGEALKELMHYYEVTSAVGGTLVTIFHNNFLGSDPQFNGWKETYETFIRSLPTLPG
ncbi:MAG: polysaccharide deacetylase family protein [Chitinophagaceae bacterium]